MNNSKFLKVVIILLVLINLSTITFLWYNRPRHHDAVRDFFAHRLHFTSQQSEQFQGLKEEHHKAIESLKELDKKNHDALLDLLKKSSIDSLALNKAVSEILEVKKKEELLTFNHFQKVRAICNDKQKKEFDEIIKEAARMLGTNQGEGHRPPPREAREDMPPPPRP